MQHTPYPKSEHILISAIARNDAAAFIKNLSHKTMNLPDEYGNTPLHAALIMGETFYAKNLVLNGADINRLSTAGISPLFLAFERKNFVVLEKMIESDSFDPHATDSHGNTPLIQAIRQRLPLVERLLRAGVDLEKRNKDGADALTFAIENKDKYVIQQLAKNGYRFNAGNPAPLFYAMRTNNAFLFKRYMMFSVDTLAKGDQGVSLQEAAENHPNPAFKILLASQTPDRRNRQTTHLPPQPIRKTRKTSGKTFRHLPEEEREKRLAALKIVLREKTMSLNKAALAFGFNSPQAMKHYLKKLPDNPFSAGLTEVSGAPETPENKQGEKNMAKKCKKHLQKNLKSCINISRERTTHE